MDIFRTPDERFADLPGYDFEPRYADIDGLRMHYVDEGEGKPVVCFHGEPTWVYLYRKVARPLESTSNVVTILASRPGERKVAAVTTAIRRARRVCAAKNPRIV